jgi:exosortase D (VPLPA-CTERM-specific)
MPALLLAGLVFVFQDGLLYMARTWSRPEYSHGYLIPLLALYLFLLRVPELAQPAPRGSWSGFVFVVVGLVGLVFGELSAIYTIVQYSFLLALFGLLVVAFGWSAFRAIWMAFALLLFMIPLPNFIYNNLIGELELMAASLAVDAIRMLSISVFLGGNALDFGSWQLVIDDACDALRALFSLLTLAFAWAAFYRGPVWQRILIVLLPVPLALGMDAGRMIAAAWLFADRGPDVAESFIGTFDGWWVFTACAGLVLGCAFLLARFSGRRLRDSVHLGPPPLSQAADLLPRRLTSRGAAALVLVVVGGALLLSLQGRQDLIPERDRFSSFPPRIGVWQGQAAFVEQRMIDSLKLDDYLVNDYRRDAEPAGRVNLWVAYYANQRKGASAHSPRSCLPGDGYEIESFRLHRVADVGPSWAPMPVNRAVITKGESTVLVYYWFVERGRIQTNEYLVKWYIFWDALTQRRTDGALVRLTTTVPDRLEMEAADRRLEQFVRDLDPVLGYYLPQRQATFENAQAQR